MSETSVLFVCTLRGGRARIAELIANDLGQGSFRSVSACFEPGPIKGLPIQVMEEVGLGFSSQPIRSVFQQYRSERTFDYVVAMCDDSGSELCELFRSNVETMYGKSSRLISWDVEDFSCIEGDTEEKLVKARQLRDRIGALVEKFVAVLGVATAAH